MNFYNGFIGHDLGPLYNSHGHRCKELDQLNFQNYILFAGDNVAVDPAKPIEKTYPFLISKSLNIDYYNVSIFNGGVDSLRLNLITWFTKDFKKPKCVVISSEFLNSVLVCDNNYNNLKACDFNNKEVVDFFDAGNFTGIFNARNLCAEKQILNFVQVPIYQIVFKDKQPLLNSNCTNIKVTDMYEHDVITKSFLKSYVKVTKRMRP